MSTSSDPALGTHQGDFKFVVGVMTETWRHEGLGGKLLAFAMAAAILGTPVLVTAVAWKLGHGPILSGPETPAKRAPVLCPPAPSVK